MQFLCEINVWVAKIISRKRTRQKAIEMIYHAGKIYKRGTMS